MRLRLKSRAHVARIELISESDNGRERVKVYRYDDLIIEQSYKYGKGYGFKFLTKYDSMSHYIHRLSQSGSKTIYSSTNRNDCTEEGRKIEFEIFKSGI